MHATTKSIAFALLGAAFATGVFVVITLITPPAPTIRTNPVPPLFFPDGQQPMQQQPNDGPWTRDLDYRWSDDGTAFGDAFTFVERAGVPSVIQNADGQLVAVFQWFPEDDEAFDKIAVAFSEDEGLTWSEPELITVNGAAWVDNGPPGTTTGEGYTRPFDPTIVQLANGNYRLYFTSHLAGTEDKIIYSAVSSDALTYELEDGERMNVVGEHNYDVAALSVGGTWHITSPGPGGPGSVYHATSIDGVNFSEPSLIGEEGGTINWTGNLVSYGEGMRFYGSSTSGLWWSYSDDGETWTEPMIMDGVGGQGGDPAVVKVGDRYLLVYVSQKVRTEK